MQVTAGEAEFATHPALPPARASFLDYFRQKPQIGGGAVILKLSLIKPFFNNGFKTASLSFAGTYPDFKDKLTIPVMTGIKSGRP